MAGSKEGARKAVETNYRQYGEDFYVKIGALGGQVKVPKGFAKMPREKASAAGAKGGAISRRK